MPIVNRKAALAVVVALSAATTIARAQPPPPNPDATRKKLEAEAQKAHQAEEYAEHYDLLRALARLPDADTETFCALGLRARRQKAYVVAARALERCLRPFRLVPPTTTEEQEVLDHRAGELEAARAAVGALTVNAPPGATLSVDGAMEIPGSVVYVAPDQVHHVEISRGGQTAALDVRVGAGQGKVLSLAFPAVELPVPPHPAQSVVLPGYLLSVFLGVTTAIFAGTAIAKAHEAEEHRKLAEATNPRACVPASNDTTNCPGFLSAAQDARAFEQAAIGVAISGAVVFGATLTIHFGTKGGRLQTRAGLGAKGGGL